MKKEIDKLIQRLIDETEWNEISVTEENGKEMLVIENSWTGRRLYFEYKDKSCKEIKEKIFGNYYEK